MQSQSELQIASPDAFAFFAAKMFRGKIAEQNRRIDRCRRECVKTRINRRWQQRTLPPTTTEKSGHLLMTSRVCIASHLCHLRPTSGSLGRSETHRKVKS